MFCQQCKEKRMCVSYVICVYQAANVRPMGKSKLHIAFGV